jgi:ADP-ribosylglycohydrolase
MMGPFLQDIPFHAGEIHLINLTAIAYSQGDFRRAMAFIVNFGRDNDTVAAVTGAILGAYLGYQALPQDMARGVITVSKQTMGIDLESLARQLTDHQFPSSL